jgi:hypothetical protein
MNNAIKVLLQMTSVSLQPVPTLLLLMIIMKRSITLLSSIQVLGTNGILPFISCYNGCEGNGVPRTRFNN